MTALRRDDARGLPSDLQPTMFSTAEARRLGVSKGRLRRSDLRRPLRGVRSTGPIVDFDGLAAAHASVMLPGQTIAGISAARVHRIPLPVDWNAREPFVVGVPLGANRPRRRGVVARELDMTRLDVEVVRGLPVLGPLATALHLAGALSMRDLVVALEAIVTPSRWYPRLDARRRPLSALAELESFAVRCAGLRGIGALRAAIPLVRIGVDSPQETITRRLIVAAVLPEPVVQHEVHADGRLVAVLDLAYVELKIDIEYEGDRHRIDPGQWDHDIGRQEQLERLGWIVIRVTARDLRDGGSRLLRRIRSAMATRAQ